MSREKMFAEDYALNSVAEDARDAGYKAEVEGDVVVISLDNRKVTTSEVRSEVLSDPSIPVFRSGDEVKVGF